MDIKSAKSIVASLADGIDPLTGEIFPRNHVCNQPEVIRALHQILSAVPDDKKAEKKESRYPNAGKPWPQEEADKLVDEFDSGMKLSDIAKEHGRSRGAIESKLANLGLIENSYYTNK